MTHAVESIYKPSHGEIASGIGCKDNYFNGYLAKSSTLSFKDINEKLPSSGIVCLAQKNHVIVARKSEDHRALLVYKHEGTYKRMVIESSLFVKNINLDHAFIITATDNFYGKDFNGGYNDFPGDNFDAVILKYFNKIENNQKTISEKTEDLKNMAIARNDHVNKIRKKNETDNTGMVVCIARGIPGVMSGIVSNNHAKKLHVQLMFKAAINDLSTIVNSHKSWQHKMWALQEFRDRFVQLPFWRKHSYTLTLLACVALGLIMGGLFGGPFFLPAILLKAAHAAAAEGAMMAFGAAATCASLHFSYHYYQFKNKNHNQEKEQAISDAARYPSLGLAS